MLPLKNARVYERKFFSCKPNPDISPDILLQKILKLSRNLPWLLKILLHIFRTPLVCLLVLFLAHNTPGRLNLVRLRGLAGLCSIGQLKEVQHLSPLVVFLESVFGIWNNSRTISFVFNFSCSLYCFLFVAPLCALTNARTHGRTHTRTHARTPH